MVPHLRSARSLAWLAAGALLLAACGQPEGTEEGEQEFEVEAEVPQLQGPPAEVGGGAGAAEAFGEATVQVTEAAPEGLHVTNVAISPTTPELVDAINFAGFRSGGPNALIELPIFGINPRQGMYYLLVPVINEGKDIVRNLKARADFFDAEGRLIWTETQFLTHFPTRLQLNPPSLPNKVERQPEYSKDASNYPLYYFPTNVGVFTFAVPDTSVSKKVRSWTLSFLVSET